MQKNSRRFAPMNADLLVLSLSSKRRASTGMTGTLRHFHQELAAPPGSLLILPGGAAGNLNVSVPLR